MKKRKSIKVITVLTVICVLVAIISAFFDTILLLFLSLKFNIDTKDATSVGIIGGADGPTAIFLSSHPSTHWIAFVFAALAILGIIYLFIEKRSEKKL